MVQTLFGKDIEFSVRTFRFSGGQSSSNQEQIINCQLHLEPADNVSEGQAPDCTCYNAEECSNECELGTDNCADEATCTDTARSFECTCNDGYRHGFSNFLSLVFKSQSLNSPLNPNSSGDGVTCNEQSALWLVYGTSSGHDVGYKGNEGSWTDVQGRLDQVDVGEIGTFGVNSLNNLYYKSGTHGNPYAVGVSNNGSAWQR